MRSSRLLGPCAGLLATGELCRLAAYVRAGGSGALVAGVGGGGLSPWWLLAALDVGFRLCSRGLSCRFLPPRPVASLRRVALLSRRLGVNCAGKERRAQAGAGGRKRRGSRGGSIRGPCPRAPAGRIRGALMPRPAAGGSGALDAPIGRLAPSLSSPRPRPLRRPRPAPRSAAPAPTTRPANAILASVLVDGSTSLCDAERIGSPIVRGPPSLLAVSAICSSIQSPGSRA